MRAKTFHSFLSLFGDGFAIFRIVRSQTTNTPGNGRAIREGLSTSSAMS